MNQQQNEPEDMQHYLTKQEYLAYANRLRQGQSEDYIKGFEDGVNWLRDYIVLELLK